MASRLVLEAALRILRDLRQPIGAEGSASPGLASPPVSAASGRSQRGPRIWAWRCPGDCCARPGCQL
eukprot:11157137-Alexandrium_andersonii.AAC.1